MWDDGVCPFEIAYVPQDKEQRKQIVGAMEAV